MAGRRGTRISRYVDGDADVSGTTLASQPSGTTIDYQGVTATQFGDGTSTLVAADLVNLASIAGPAIGATSVSALRISSDVTNWAGASVAIATGLTTIVSFVATYRITDGGADVSEAQAVQYFPSATAGVVTASLYAQADPTGTLAIAAAGGSIGWMAIGT